ncbi:amino acid adenylation domain-containing protein [Algibacter mikhailovii]|uniref:amino acid adenylation domain-containing protein n=1 Tax=Algibacter mikhailovii TaxID=425498 RepID=UPI00249419DD|nr:amino acid adenylation domain-containing protein [Algibacter mikhailovii]
MNLTQSQFSIWMGQKLNPDAPLYNMVHVFSIHGSLNVDHFKAAFQKLIQNTDALRTVFYEKDNRPEQHVLPTIDYDMSYLDFNGKNETQIFNWIKERSQKDFELSEVLFDSVLLKISDQEYRWYLNIHHLITDATSSTILYEYMSSYYKKINTGIRDDFEAIPNFESFLDYESKSILSEKSESIRAYWKQKLEGLNKSITLYGNKGDYKTTKSKRVVIELNPERLDKLNEISLLPEVRSWSKDLTYFNIFCTILFVFLKRVSNANTIIIGTPSHNRLSKKFKKTPGLFVEFFPLLAQIESEDSFQDILVRVKLEINNYLRHAQPGMSTPDLNKSYNVILNYINAEFSDFNDFYMTSEWVHPDHCDPNHYLRCHVYDMDRSGRISILLDLNQHVFDDELINNISKHFLNIFDAFLENRNQAIGKFPMASDHEKQALISPLQESNKTYRSIIETFEEQVIKNPNAIAIQCDNETLTYSGLNKRVNKLAHYLIEHGVVFGDKIALYNYRETQYIINLLAVMKLGGTFIPIASNQPIERIAYIVDNSNCSMILVPEELESKIEHFRIAVINLSSIQEELKNRSSDNLNRQQDADKIAYVLYTSGSTGHPKGVMVSNKALSNYIFWGRSYYNITSKSAFALCTSIGFDLTISSTFFPLVSGGRMVIYKENYTGPDIAILDVLKENLVNTIKLTPSHLSLFQDKDMRHSSIDKIIVGGEDFKASLGHAITKAFSGAVTLYNEYGPTEATVGCIVSEYNPKKHQEGSIPIGTPIANMHAYILDKYKNLVPNGVVGELYLSGSSLADGYLKLEELTSNKFIENPFVKNAKMYHTGDLARINSNGEYEYLGRVDEQIKLRGYRIELADIESNLTHFKGVNECAVVLVKNKKEYIPEEHVINCTECGLPSNYPQTDFDEYGVCNLCNAFKGYKDKAQKYFKTEEELKSILTTNTESNPSYDCLSLLSGGKDSTYILAQLVGMGLKVLAFTLDNGYISNQAKANIDRIVKKLNVDHIYGATNHMNEIFIDSLNRHQNVCNGCFKTIYTLSTKIAMDKQIPFIVTGLSRGQFFETRLTEELFWNENLNVKKIDETILEVRKLYHREDDAVKDLLEVSMFEDDEVFDKVQFVDFYRYSDVSLEDMLKYLEDKVGWVRPTDTGRSTNCLINQLGIYVHKKEKGYSNYSFPYSWDVRLGHKTRDESLEEINEYIDEEEVKRIMNEIGYEESDSFENEDKLVAYYTGDNSISSKDLKKYISEKLPAYMIPSRFKFLDEMPLTKNGKVDKKTLQGLNSEQLELETSYLAPRNEIDELIEGIWKEVLRLKKIGIQDNFIALGGHSLAAIRVTSRINEELGMEIPLNKVFNLPTIEEYSNYIEKTMLEYLEN